MAEPTLKDVLKAISEMRGEMATKTDLAKLDAKVDDLEAKMSKRFDKVDKSIKELDEDLDKHMKVHKELEKDVEAIKGQAPRTGARVPPRRPRAPVSR
jgi:chromosome segregation ATPase